MNVSRETGVYVLVVTFLLLSCYFLAVSEEKKRNWFDVSFLLVSILGQILFLSGMKAGSAKAMKAGHVLLPVSVMMSLFLESRDLLIWSAVGTGVAILTRVLFRKCVLTEQEDRVEGKEEGGEGEKKEENTLLESLNRDSIRLDVVNCIGFLIAMFCLRKARKGRRGEWERGED
jgi:Ca2+/Na+ antiporter